MAVKIENERCWGAELDYLIPRMTVTLFAHYSLHISVYMQSLACSVFAQTFLLYVEIARWCISLSPVSISRQSQNYSF